MHFTGPRCLFQSFPLSYDSVSLKIWVFSHGFCFLSLGHCSLFKLLHRNVCNIMNHFPQSRGSSIPVRKHTGPPFVYFCGEEPLPLLFHCFAARCYSALQAFQLFMTMEKKDVYIIRCGIVFVIATMATIFLQGQMFTVFEF